MPSKKSRVCSKHFVEGRPTAQHPYPEVNMGYDCLPKKCRPAPKQRPLPQLPPKKVRVRSVDVASSGCCNEAIHCKTADANDSVSLACSIREAETDVMGDTAECQNAVSYCGNMTSIVDDLTDERAYQMSVDSSSVDHSYATVRRNRSCNGCLQKNRQIEELQKQLADLQDQLAACKAQNVLIELLCRKNSQKRML
jgi:hypothetical protein